MSLEVLTTCTVSEAWQRNITLPPRDCASGYENLHFQGSTVHGGSQNRSLINSSQRYNNALIHGWLLPQRLVEQAKAPAIIGHNSIKMVVQTFHCYWSESSLQLSGSRLHVPHFKHHPAQLLEGMSTGGRIGCISFLYYKYLVFGKSINHVRWVSYLLAYRNLYLCHNVNFWRCLSVLVSQPTRDHKHKNLNNSRQGVMQHSHPGDVGNDGKQPKSFTLPVPPRLAVWKVPKENGGHCWSAFKPERALNPVTR